MNKPETKITPVILSGGQGTRLWPLSRSDKPKQFIPLISDESLFEQTLSRCSDDALFEVPVIVCSQKHRFLVKKLLPENLQGKSEIIMEPCGRNTAAAICVAALAAPSGKNILLFLPSDHYIPDPKAFHETIKTARVLAEGGDIVTFGIEPDSPHTGFGYIKSGEEKEPGFKIKSFHEKPDVQKAESYLAEGGFYWNAGIFMAQANVMLEEIQTHASDILENVKTAWEARQKDLGDTLLDPQKFADVRPESIDYAVLEKTDKAAIIPAAFPWNDLGSWEALWCVSAATDEKGNYAKGPVYTQDVENAYLRSEGPVLAALGLNDIVAVAMPDAVFIAPKDRSEEVKKLVEDMKASKQSQVIENTKTLRPWGSYEIMDEKEGFKVKKLIVDPGCKLSLQKHEHRSEHWVVVKGVATVTRNDEVFDVPVNESVYVPCGAVHRLENKGGEPLEIIEVQTGSYLGEDDIIRLEDDYNRIEIDEKKVAKT